MKRIKFVKKKSSDLQIRFCSFLVPDSSEEATELEKKKKGPKFPRGPELRGFYGILES
jgi:hypothetical protein